MSKTMVILTGPQGAGNHLFSKVLSLHSEVYGWKDLLKTDWIGHDKEPFAEYWLKPNKLYDFDWNQSNYYVTSISCPYYSNGELTIPKYTKFIDTLLNLDINVRVGIIGRDQTILKHQQNRVRGEVTIRKYYQELKKLMRYDPVFISPELLFLNRHHYLESLQNYLKIPVVTKGSTLKKIIQDDTNFKYIQYVNGSLRDDAIRAASSKHD